MVFVPANPYFVAIPHQNIIHRTFEHHLNPISWPINTNHPASLAFTKTLPQAADHHLQLDQPRSSNPHHLSSSSKQQTTTPPLQPLSLNPAGTTTPSTHALVESQSTINRPELILGILSSKLRMSWSFSMPWVCKSTRPPRRAEREERVALKTRAVYVFVVESESR